MELCELALYSGLVFKQENEILIYVFSLADGKNEQITKWLKKI